MTNKELAERIVAKLFGSCDLTEKNPNRKFDQENVDDVLSILSEYQGESKRAICHRCNKSDGVYIGCRNCKTEVEAFEEAEQDHITDTSKMVVSEEVKPIGYASDPLILHSPHEDCGTIAELEDDSYRGNLYSQETIDQLQEKIAELQESNKNLVDAVQFWKGFYSKEGELYEQNELLATKYSDTEAKLKEAEELLNDVNEYENKVTYSEANASLEEHGVLHRIKDFLDTIRKERSDADKS